jgi:CheY-like chemotaxis protein
MYQDDYSTLDYAMNILLVAANASGSDFDEFLREAGHNVTVAESAAAALDRSQSKDFDAVIVDEALPGLSGFELVERMKLDNLTDGIAKPVLMLVNNHVGSELAIRHGADSVIFKNTDQLLFASGLSARLREVEAALNDLPG